MSERTEKLPEIDRSSDVEFLRGRQSRFLRLLGSTAWGRKIEFHLWITSRFVLAERKRLTLPSLLSLLGMAVSVACLTVAMAVVSGYEKTLETAIIDVFGHVQVIKNSDQAPELPALMRAIDEVAPELRASTQFINIEGLLAGEGSLSGVLIQGVDLKSFESVLKIRPRVIRGDLSFASVDGVPSALVGKAIAKKFNLEVGKSFRLVIPRMSKSDSTNFSPKVQSFVLAGVLDLGKAEYDERTVLISLPVAQEYVGAGDGFSGLRLLLSDAKQAPEVASRLAMKLGAPFFVMDWTEVNRNLFEAVRIERIAIFFVILILVVAACFNISSGLFVSVLNRYSDISILRAMGFTQSDVSRIFVFQGLFFGIVGTIAGLLGGIALGLVFVIAQRYVVLLPVEAYRLDHIGIEIRVWDAIAIVVSATLICLLSTLIPARRGAKLDPVQGLRYE